MSVSTNGSRIVTRLRVKAPGYADLYRLRLEVVRGFYRAVENREVSEEEAVSAYRHGVPSLRIADERLALEKWLAGRGTTNDAEGISMMRRIFEPGKASRRDVLIFASRLFLYPPQRDLKLAGKYESLSFREAVKFARIDPLTRMIAYYKANDLPVLGGGRGEELAAAAMDYRTFLLEFAKAEKSEQELLDLLDAADVKLNVAFEHAQL